MKHKILLTAIFTAVALFAADRANEDRLQRGIDLLETKGDAQGAAKLFEEASRSSDRSVAARALLYLGSSYQKLGQDKALAVYDRVVNQFGDQKEAAAEARTRLAVLRAKSAKDAGTTVRQVWKLPPEARLAMGPISPDGRYIVYLDTTTKNEIVVHDLATNEDRRFAKFRDNPGNFAAAACAISRDDKQIACAGRGPGASEQNSLEVADLQRESATPFSVPFPQATAATPLDWSQESNLLAVTLAHRPPQHAELAIVSVRDGSFAVPSIELQPVIQKVALPGGEPRSIPAYRTCCAIFSPDGKYIAYNTGGADGSNIDIFVRQVAGGPEIPVVVDPADDDLVGWSADGKYLLFGSERMGPNTWSLWAQPMDGGKPAGDPVFLRSTLAASHFRTTSSGALIYTQSQANKDIKVASFDFETERFLSQPAVGVKEFSGSNSQMDWSPDGKYLVSVSNRAGQQEFAVHSADTGALIREVRPAVALTTGQGFGPPAVRWTPDSRGFAAAASDAVGRQGIYRIDAESGAASPIVLAGAGESLGAVSFSPDGKKIAYYHLPLGSNVSKTLVERELATGIERELLRAVAAIDYGGVSYSPDGRFIATGKSDRDQSAIVILPLAGGAARELLREPTPDGFSIPTSVPDSVSPDGYSILSWTPDSRSLFLARGSLGSGVQIWRVSIDTGQLHRVNFDEKAERVLRIHPDGRRIAYRVLEQSSTEVWALENFLPAASGKR